MNVILFDRDICYINHGRTGLTTVNLVFRGACLFKIDTRLLLYISTSSSKLLFW